MYVRTYVWCMYAGGVASVWRSWVRSTIIYRFLCGFICVSLCQGIKIQPTNMYVCSIRKPLAYARASKLTTINMSVYIARARCECQMAVGSGGLNACWSYNVGAGCRVPVFSLILDSSVGLSAGIQSAGDLVSETLMGSNPAFSRGRQIVSFRFEYRLPVPEHRN